MLRRFPRRPRRKNISISYGYAYTDDIGKTSFKRLLDEADHKMYMHKEQIHTSLTSGNGLHHSVTGGTDMKMFSAFLMLCLLLSCSCAAFADQTYRIPVCELYSVDGY